MISIQQAAATNMPSGANRGREFLVNLLPNETVQNLSQPLFFDFAGIEVTAIDGDDGAWRGGAERERTSGGGGDGMQRDRGRATD